MLLLLPGASCEWQNASQLPTFFQHLFVAPMTSTVAVSLAARKSACYHRLIALVRLLLIPFSEDMSARGSRASFGMVKKCNFNHGTSLEGKKMPAKVNLFQTCMSEVGELTQVLHICLQSCTSARYCVWNMVKRSVMI